MTFTPTQGQADALKMVSALLDDDNPAFGVLTGYAGTGKTTLLKVLADQEGAPLILTPTGKAAMRVSEATGGLPASTIHRWLYKPGEDLKTGDPIWTKKPMDEIAGTLPGNGLIVVDEASMVSDQLWGDLWGICHTIGLKVLLVGDRFQLAPVRPENQAFSTLTSLKTQYRTDLTEVVRQAMDNPIVRASMLIREGEEEAMEAVGSLPSSPSRQLIEQFLKMDANRALIAWRNETRQKLNLACRKQLGRPLEDIAVGEPLLVMNNNYILDRFNGEVVEFAGWEQPPQHQIAVRNAPKNLSIFASYGLGRIRDIIQPAFISPEEVFSQTLEMPAKTMAFYSRVYARDVFG